MNIEKWTTPDKFIKTRSAGWTGLFLESIKEKTPDFFKNEPDLKKIHANFSWTIQKPGLNKRFFQENSKDIFIWNKIWENYADTTGANLHWKDVSHYKVVHIIEFTNLEGLAKACNQFQATRTGLNRISRLIDVDTRFHGLLKEWQYITSIPDGDFEIIIDFCTKFSKSKNGFKGARLREIPVEGMHTKFIDDNKSLLAHILKCLKFEENPDATHFAERFGFKRDVTQRFLLKDLDGTILPFEEVSLRYDIFEKICPKKIKFVVIVENENTFRALGPQRGGIAICGGGNNAATLGGIKWLRDKPCLYMGDMDRAGFWILNNIRKGGLNVISRLMSPSIFSQYSKYIVPDEPKDGDDRRYDNLEYLTATEKICMSHCSELWPGTNRAWHRLEQERIPINVIDEEISNFVCDKC